jgi:hypothetical protein
MPDRLLDRQVSLLEYLTNADAIFGDGREAPTDATLQGIDPALLRLEARFSHEKRLEKIASVLPRTLAMMGSGWGPVFQEFAAACPPTDIHRLANARQFHDFLRAYWRRNPPQPPYLPDVLACEIARAEIRRAHDDPKPAAADEAVAVPRGIRRSRRTVLLRCSYDMRSIFAPESGDSVPQKRDATLAVAQPAGAQEPCVFELTPAMFDLLATLEDWVDPSAFGARNDWQEVIRDLAAYGLVEVRG